MIGLTKDEGILGSAWFYNSPERFREFWLVCYIEILTEKPNLHFSLGMTNFARQTIFWAGTHLELKKLVKKSKPKSMP